MKYTYTILPCTFNGLTYIKRVEAGSQIETVIPSDPTNKDYIEYIAWLSAGNTPEPAEVQVTYTRYTGKAKFDLFTPEEQRAIAGAAMTDVEVKLFYDRFTIADYITYGDPEMVRGLEFMEQRGFLTPERHTAVIAEMTR
ncbi:hypothetical protein [Comamonas sp. 17RB]|uniref:hypothetical protein n=1 Tax=Comamonas sp. 17RB TaxID=3047025 RepID=UPI0024B776C9|nr:hypothetical protein [Comamonas sp. 17RB]MDI9853799.1 hypothetical protein [Comamonas sp. 17RB]